MISVKPFKGLRPKTEITDKVCCPPYDVLSSSEARDKAANNPVSFLHINKPEVDLSADMNPYDEKVYQTGRENLLEFIKDGTLIQDKSDSVYIYRITWQGHSQTGFFLLSSIKDYDEGRIKKHEFTRPKKEKDRTVLIDTMNAQVGPVFLLYIANDRLDTILEQVTSTPAAIDFNADDSVNHELWIVQEKNLLEKIVNGFAKLDYTYVADGHHRTASASNVCKQRQRTNPNPTGEESYNYFLSAVFPHNQLKILAYNRVVQDLNGLAAEEFLTKVSEKFTVTKCENYPEISTEKTFAMYLENDWYLLTANKVLLDSQNILDDLDVNILTNNLLKPVLNISDLRTDPRIDFVGGIRGGKELERLVDSGKFKVAFAVYATTVKSLIDIADANEIMPPKSTWFEPKLRSGLVTYLY
jgi:uncharacterized protein (DUF1015 family)